MKIDISSFRNEVKKTQTKIKLLFSSLKKMPSAKVDMVFHSEHESVFSELNCLECANCCKTTSPLLELEDLHRIAKHLRISTTEFMQNYVEMDEDGDFVFTKTPCFFLQKDNTCSIYSFRPKACAEYPHTNRKRIKQILDITEKNTAVCPAVYEIVKRIEKNLET